MKSAATKTFDARGATARMTGRAAASAATVVLLLACTVARAEEKAPAPEVSPPKVRPQLGLYGAGEVLGRRLGLEVEAGLAIGQLSFALRVAPGPSVGLGLDAQYRLLRSVVSPLLGVRASGYAALGAWGGGLSAALDVRALPQLSLRARFCAEYLFGPASVQHVLLVAGVGVTVSFE